MLNLISALLKSNQIEKLYSALLFNDTASNTQIKKLHSALLFNDTASNTHKCHI